MNLKSEIRQFVVDNFLYGKDDKSLQDDTSFFEKGFIDSTGAIELVAYVNDRYGIEVSDEELIPDNFDSINKLANFILSKNNGSKH